MEPTRVDGFDLYFQWVKGTEPPAIFHRWAFIAAVGAWLGQRTWFPFGDGRLFPNQYIMFIGDPGTRKSSAIKRAAKLIGKAGYENFGPQRTSKEKFLLDLAANSWDEDGVDEDGDFNKGRRKDDAIDILKNLNLEGIGNAADRPEPREVFVAADEFNNFLGNGNLDFQSLLGELWDWDEPERFYKQRLKTSKSISIYQPTISILGGNTPQGFADCFPLASIGQGFMSRLLLIHSEPSGVKSTIPPSPDESVTKRLLLLLTEMRIKVTGPLSRTEEAFLALDTIYKSWPELEDTRFRHYSNRRFTHLLKLCIICAALRLSTKIDIRDVLYANTLLHFAEMTMPKAIGELGKARNSEAANKVMQYMHSSKEIRTMREIWKVVQNDLEKIQDLATLLQGLQEADKIQTLKNGKGEQGFLPKRKAINMSTPYVNFDLLKGKELK